MSGDYISRLIATAMILPQLLCSVQTRDKIHLTFAWPCSFPVERFLMES